MVYLQDWRLGTRQNASDVMTQVRTASSWKKYVKIIVLRCSWFPSTHTPQHNSFVEHGFITVHRSARFRNHVECEMLGWISGVIVVGSKTHSYKLMNKVANLDTRWHGLWRHEHKEARLCFRQFGRVGFVRTVWIGVQKLDARSTKCIFFWDTLTIIHRTPFGCIIVILIRR